MKILAIEPYYGGSHKAFIDGWMKNSTHQFDLLTLQPNKWKWRMRHSALYFAETINEKLSTGQSWDRFFTTDMLNLAELLGLVDKKFRDIPSAIYFHENQLTYPQRFESERDYQYVITNMTSALAADQVWFNSNFHKTEFLTELRKSLKRMPDNQPLSAVDKIEEKSEVFYPGLEEIKPMKKNNSTPHVLWCGRWEHDKNPEDFFSALKILKACDVKFNVSVLGEQFRDSPEIFDWAKEYFANEIINWSYQKTKEDYIRVLQSADIVVSTAIHEFFGISILEAVSAGAYPMLPNRLSYPEIIEHNEQHLYDGTVNDLVKKLTKLLKDPINKPNINIEKFQWPNTAGLMDEQIAN
jgi:glycosyltransferase involved in cell wall biosynthesis